MRALLGIAAHSCKVFVRGLKTAPQIYPSGVGDRSILKLREIQVYGSAFSVEKLRENKKNNGRGGLAAHPFL